MSLENHGPLENSRLGYQRYSVKSPESEKKKSRICQVRDFPKSGKVGFIERQGGHVSIFAICLYEFSLENNILTGGSTSLLFSSFLVQGSQFPQPVEVETSTDPHPHDATLFWKAHLRSPSTVPTSHQPQCFTAPPDSIGQKLLEGGVTNG